jgi:hypothetical protein
MRVLLVALALAASACAPTLTASNVNGGIVRLGGSLTKEADALAAADAYCARSGRTARVTSSGIIQIAFDCVPPPSS